jgi:predicted N-acyltransferase
VERQGPDDDVFRRLLGELQRRGWAWKYESSGRGYTVKAEKSWPPSSFQTMRTFADTREDAAMVVLVEAIQHEAEQSGMNGDAQAA